MSADISALKTAVDLRALVSETHDISRDGKALCPAHVDTHPSCHIYPDGAHCYACGWHADHITWLELVHLLDTAEAIRELERRAGGYVPTAPRRQAPPPQKATFKPIDEKVLEQHLRRAERLDRAPLALEGRGFTVDDLRCLQVAAYGDDAVIPITGPDGTVLALKRRYSAPYKGQRYRYTTPGHGTPAWCSPNFLTAEVVFICEGELNAAACWLAAPELAVMGVAGTSGALHLDALKSRTVYCYADADEPGQKARDRWAAQALSVGATQVFVLAPWPADACDTAGTEGRAALAETLKASLETAQSFDAAKPFSASNTASKDSRLGGHKPLLMFSCSGFSSKPKLGGKPCL